MHFIVVDIDFNFSIVRHYRWFISRLPSGWLHLNSFQFDFCLSACVRKQVFLFFYSFLLWILFVCFFFTFLIAFIFTEAFVQVSDTKKWCWNVQKQKESQMKFIYLHVQTCTINKHIDILLFVNTAAMKIGPSAGVFY